MTLHCALYKASGTQGQGQEGLQRQAQEERGLRYAYTESGLASPLCHAVFVETLRHGGTAPPQAKRSAKS